jgi:tetratricopeptide (TPR) repeat protein
MRLADRTPDSDPHAETELNEGIRNLDVALEIAPESWPAWWLRGKAEQALKDHEAAYESFERSYRLHAANPDVGRELVAECLETGRSGEAVAVAEAISRENPQDEGLLANLALAQLLNGHLDEALRVADAALRLDPDDAITKTVRRRIEDVRAGRRPQPTKLGDLQR